jgi:hypothetical protein
MGLHDQILKELSKDLLEKVAHFGAGDVKDLKKNSEELLAAFQKKISKFIHFIRVNKVAVLIILTCKSQLNCRFMYTQETDLYLFAFYSSSTQKERIHNGCSWQSTRIRRNGSLWW